MLLQKCMQLWSFKFESWYVSTGQRLLVSKFLQQKLEAEWIVRCKGIQSSISSCGVYYLIIEELIELHYHDPSSSHMILVFLPASFSRWSTRHEEGEMRLSRRPCSSFLNTRTRAVLWPAEESTTESDNINQGPQKIESTLGWRDHSTNFGLALIAS